MDAETLTHALQVIEGHVHTIDDPLATDDTTDGDPFRILVSCILSQRTKEEVTTVASQRLFAIASTSSEMSHLSVDEIATVIYPVGFWKTKARHISRLSEILLRTHGGTVPSSMDELLRLPGVGRKTANLVLSVGFDLPAICVDTHVHRIMNRLGFVKSRTPEETEMALRTTLPQDAWKDVNYLLVIFGRNVCTPLSPRCSDCGVVELCERVGVERSR